MKACETNESMKHRMRPVTWAMAAAAAGTVIVWAGIVTRWTTEHELAAIILFSAAIPCLVASAVFSAIAAVRLGKPPESPHHPRRTQPPPHSPKGRRIRRQERKARRRPHRPGPQHHPLLHPRRPGPPATGPSRPQAALRPERLGPTGPFTRPGPRPSRPPSVELQAISPRHMPLTSPLKPQNGPQRPKEDSQASNPQKPLSGRLRAKTPRNKNRQPNAKPPNTPIPLH